MIHGSLPREASGRAHCELDAGGGLIMLATPSPDYESPRRQRETCERARRWSAVPWIIDGVLVYVDDLDAHFERARAAGARILSEIESGPPGRRYRAEDPRATAGSSSSARRDSAGRIHGDGPPESAIHCIGMWYTLYR